MANQEHLERLHQGVEAWNRWRKERWEWEQREILCVMDGVTLDKKRLPSVDLSGANLEKKDWRHINLQGANLQGTRLVRADLRDADLSYSDLSRAIGNQVNLERANLSHASLIQADMADVNLCQVNMREANVSWTRFFHTFLRDADLRQADLSNTNFTWATLHGVNFQEAHVSHTIFGDVDLSEVKGLETLHHWRPSVIDIRTLTRSSGRIPENFLREAGIDSAIIPKLLALFHPYHGCETIWYSEEKPVSPWLTTQRPQEYPEPERADFSWKKPWEEDNYPIDDSE